jgi:hypothetical protein
VDAHAEPDGQPAAAELLQHLQVHLGGLPAAAVLLGVRQPEQARLAERAEQLARELRLRLAVGGARGHLALDQVGGQLEQVPRLRGRQAADDGRHADLRSGGRDRSG